MSESHEIERQRRKPGPKPRGERAMTPLERLHRHRAKKRAAARERGFGLTEEDIARLVATG